MKTNTAKHSKEVWKNCSIKKKKLLLQSRTEELQRIVAFTTGHGRFRAHLTKTNILAESKCKLCEKDKTVKHSFAALRQRTIGRMYCELTDYARLDFDMYRKFCNSAFERAWTPTNE